MDAPTPSPRARGPLIALGLAGAAVVLAAITTIVVLTRGGDDAPATKARLAEARTTADALATALDGEPLKLESGRMIATDPAALGLAKGDLVLSIGGAPVKSGVAGRMQLRRLLRDSPEALLFEVERGGALTVVRVTIDGDRTQLAQRRPTLDLTGAAADSDLPTPGAASFDGVTKIDDTHAQITRTAVDQILANPMAVAKGARVVPSIKNGEPDGFKLYAIRPGSVYAALGFANGDTIRAINGMELTSADRALEVYTQLRDATRLELDVLRRGQPITLTIEIK